MWYSIAYNFESCRWLIVTLQNSNVIIIRLWVFMVHFNYGELDVVVLGEYLQENAMIFENAS